MTITAETERERRVFEHVREALRSGRTQALLICLDGQALRFHQIELETSSLLLAFEREAASFRAIGPRLATLPERVGPG